MQANKQDVGRLLKTAKGQIDGILKMIEEDRYCMEISHQIMAAEAILNKANREVLKAHVQGCVKDGIESERRCRWQGSGDLDDFGCHNEMREKDR